MTVDEVLAELEAKGNASIKKTLMKHGAKEPFFGTKIEDLKKIQKRIKVDHELALKLYDTGISDAMYLAGLIVDDEKMSKKDLNKWVKQAYWNMLCAYAVPWAAAESAHGWELAMEWIESKKETIAVAGWSTLSSLVAITEDQYLDVDALKKLLDRVQKTIHSQPNQVRYTMNGFVIALGSYVAPLSAAARKAAESIGEVKVDMGETACLVPDAGAYIQKAIDRGSLTKKRKMARC